ncbi:MAG: TetR/AcrR family transcriptional regulator [Octadecabacter sp.]
MAVATTRQTLSKEKTLPVARRDKTSLDEMPLQHGKTGRSCAENSLNFANALRLRAQGARKGERTKISLQVATCEFLDAYPIRDLTVATICKATGVAHGTMYVYFKDRNAIVADVLMGFVEFVQHSMRDVSYSGSTDVVRKVGSTYYDLFEQNKGLMRCLVSYREEFPEAIIAFQSLNSSWLKSVVASLRRRNRASHLDDDELLRRAYALGGMVDQYLTALLLNNDKTLAEVSPDREVVIDTLTTLWNLGFEK